MRLKITREQGSKNTTIHSKASAIATSIFNAPISCPKQGTICPSESKQLVPHPTISIPNKHSSSQGNSELTVDKPYANSLAEHAFTLGPISIESDNTPTTEHVSTAIQLGPVNMLNPFEHHVVGHPTSESVVMSVFSGKLSRSRIRKRLSAFFKGDRKAKDVTPAEDKGSALQNSHA
ncbi:MAG: hypothetical protein J3R72DRAFT_46111 [Linnemannia gamsii]|nr:MAG: hypothetical protein J3R72DRAFT_46111 [Linnemannia gamsii]